MCLPYEVGQAGQQDGQDGQDLWESPGVLKGS